MDSDDLFKKDKLSQIDNFFKEILKIDFLQIDLKLILI